jgi:hypothetical protein
MIMRVWRGWTTEANAQAFELFLCEENFQAIAGFHGMSVLRLDSPGEVEFMTIMKFDSLDAVRRRPLRGRSCARTRLAPC